MLSLVEIGSVVLEKNIFKNFVNVFSLFRNYLPSENGGALHLNILEFPLPKDALCQFWLKLVQWFWRRTVLNFVNVFSIFHNYLPLEKGEALHLNKFEFPFTEGCFVSILVEIGPVVLEEDENLKSLRQRQR